MLQSGPEEPGTKNLCTLKQNVFGERYTLPNENK